MKIYKCADGTEYISLKIEYFFVEEIIAFLEKHRGKLLGVCFPEDLCIEIDGNGIRIDTLEAFTFVKLMVAHQNNDKDRINFINKLKRFFDETKEGMVFDELYEQLTIDGFFDKEGDE